MTLNPIELDAARSRRWARALAGARGLTRTALAGVIAALLALAMSEAARADPAPADARARALASYERAEKAAASMSFAEALSAYREAAALDPTAPFVPAARARADQLAARSEGDFAPLAKLEAVRRSPAISSDRAAIEALERDLLRFPDGRVRSEARLVAAEAWWHRLDDPARAAQLLDQALADPAADKLTRGLALAELVAVRREQGDIDAARAAVDRYPDVAPALRETVHRLARRVSLRRASLAALAALVAISAISIARAARATPLRDLWRSLMSPLSVAFALYLGAAGALLVRLHGGADARPFLWLGLGVLGVTMIARSWRLGSTDQRAGARAARALACAAGVVAVAFLALERTDAGYLESFGL